MVHLDIFELVLSYNMQCTVRPQLCGADGDLFERVNYLYVLDMIHSDPSEHIYGCPGLRVHEFVPHPGYFGIYLSQMAVGRDTSDEEAAWITLNDYIEDETDDSATTGIQAFAVDLPGNISCDH